MEPITGVVEGKYWYTGSDVNGVIAIFDISDTVQPPLVSHLTVDGDWVYSVAKSGNYLYAVTQADESTYSWFVIVDVHDPTLPVVAATLNAPGSSYYKVAAAGNCACVATDAGLAIFDVSNPHAPELVAVQGSDPKNSVCMNDSFAYAITNENTLAIVDVADPRHPQGRGELYLCSGTVDAAISGRYVFAPSDDSFRVVDVSNPDAPFVAADLFSDFTIDAVIEVSGGIAYTCGDVFFMVDVSDPLHPLPMGGPNADVQSIGEFALAVQDSVAYVCTFGEGYVIDCRDLGSPVLADWAPSLETRAVEVRDSLAYVVAYNSGFFVVNVSNPEHPYEVGSTSASAFGFDVTLADTLAYVSGGNDVRIINVARPDNPTEIGRFNAPSATQGLVVRDSLLFLMTFQNGLRIINVRHPDQPVEIGHLDGLGWTYDVALRDSFAFIAADDSGLVIVSIADPAQPVVVGSVRSQAPYDVKLAGSRLYVLDFHGLAAYDISNPTHPARVGYVAGYGWRLALRDSFAYLANDIDGELDIVNVADPTRMRRAGIVFAVAEGAWIQDTMAFVAGNGLAIASVAHPHGAQIVRYYDLTASQGCAIHFGAIAEDFAFVSSDSGLLCVDVVPPESLNWAGTCAIPAHSYLDVGGDKVYMAGEDSMRIVSVADRRRPVQVGACAGPGTGLRVRDSLVYAAARTPDSIGLRIVNVVDSSRPREVGFCRFPSSPSLGDCRGIALALPYVYCAGDSDYAAGIWVVNATNPNAPECLRFVATGSGWTNQVAVAGHYLYVAEGYSGVSIMDIANPESLIEVARYQDSANDWTSTVSVSGGFAFVACNAGLFILNVADPTNPVLNGYCKTDEPIIDVFSAGDIAYACGEFSISIIQSGPPTALKSGRRGSTLPALSVFPNPARGSITIRYSLPELQRFSLKLYDVAGRMARSLAAGSARAGDYCIRLDTRAIARGVYFLRCDVGDRVLTRKLAIE